MQTVALLPPHRFEPPRRFDYNLLVIGAGAGGLVTSYIAAATRAKVMLVESHQMGGDCLNYGCVPSKALVSSARRAHDLKCAFVQAQKIQEAQGTQETQEAQEAQEAQWQTLRNAVLPFSAVKAHIQAAIEAIEPHDSRARYTALGVDVVQGHACLVDPWTVEINAQTRVTAKNIVIATGARPFMPLIPGLEDIGAFTSETLWRALAHASELPRHIAILGAGPVGCELAQALQRLGAQVTLIEKAAHILPREDEDVARQAALALSQEGVRVLTRQHVTRAALQGGIKTLWLNTSQQNTPAATGAVQTITCDWFICATGRTARLEGFGLETLGIHTQSHANGTQSLPVNAYLQTNYPHIYAVGDVTGRQLFTHVAAHQAWYAAVNALFGCFKRFRVDERWIPTAVFLDPEIARVGLTEKQAKAQGIAYEITQFDWCELDRAIVDGDVTGFIKVLTPPNKDTLLGVTIVGRLASDLLAPCALAMKHGLGLKQLLQTIHIYPSRAEGIKYTAGAWRRAHQPQRLLAWLARFHAWRRG